MNLSACWTLNRRILLKLLIRHQGRLRRLMTVTVASFHKGLFEGKIFWCSFRRKRTMMICIDF